MRRIDECWLVKFFVIYFNSPLCLFIVLYASEPTTENKAKLDIGTKQSITKPEKVSQEKNFKYLNETFATEALGVNENKFDDHELKKLFVKLYKPNVFEETVTTVAQTTQMIKISRSQSRAVERRPIRMVNDYKAEIKCYVCDSEKGESCYRGIKKTKTCSLASKCYVEVHPSYVRRGCLFADRLNRTFFCKCPLCNNKPVSEDSFFNYKSLQEWRFDNHRLKIDLIDNKILCKYCSTDGSQSTTDSQCFEGRDVPETHCGKDEICFTNIDDELALISRGCMKRPVYNSIYFFCEDSLCNNQNYSTPEEELRSDEEIFLQSLLNVPQRLQRRSMSNDDDDNIGHAYDSNIYMLFFTAVLFV